MIPLTDGKPGPQDFGVVAITISEKFNDPHASAWVEDTLTDFFGELTLRKSFLSPILDAEWNAAIRLAVKTVMTENVMHGDHYGAYAAPSCDAEELAKALFKLIKT